MADCRQAALGAEMEEADIKTPSNGAELDLPNRVILVWAANTVLSK